jgi:AAA15 family ATPase/GTPase
MLLSFEFENFRSMQDRQTLSLVRAGDGTKSRLAIDEELAGGAVSPIAVIFGANASGKSTVIEALWFVRRIIRHSARQEAGVSLPNPAFALDDDSRGKPFRCETWFTVGEREYKYSFAISDGIVSEEGLKEISQGPSRRTIKTLFSRQTQEGASKIAVSPGLPGSKKAIIDATRPNSLFLSKAVQENFEPLMDVYNWFVDSSFESGGDPGLAQLESDPDFGPWIKNFLVEADLGVVDIMVRNPSRPPSDLVARLADTDDPEDLARVEEELIRRRRRPELLHRRESSIANTGAIAWNHESRGTRELWDVAADVYSALKSGKPLIIDELSSLHPMLVRKLLETFQSRRTNPHDAQLIFTSHDLNLLGSWGGHGFILDRDQIWLTEKEYHSGATTLMPLTDFSPRKDEDIERMYLQGRYGAVPSIGVLAR